MKKLFIIIFTVGFLLMTNQAVAAGSGLIYPNPTSGSFDTNDTFKVEIVADGQGSRFNAAKVDITPSSNLLVQDLTLGDCDFAFVNTPSVQNLSFTGVILGGSSTKCIVYKMTVRVTGGENASLSLSNGSIKAYKTAAEMLGSVKNASFTVNSANPSVSSNTTTTTTGASEQLTIEPASYTVVLTVNDEDGSPVKNALTVLKSAESETGKSIYQTQLSQQDGTVKFTDVPKGVYAVEANYKNKKLIENVISVSGKTNTITLGIQAKKTFNFLWLLLLIPILFVAVLIPLIISRKKYPNHITNVSEYSK